MGRTMGAFLTCCGWQALLFGSPRRIGQLRAPLLGQCCCPPRRQAIANPIRPPHHMQNDSASLGIGFGVGALARACVKPASATKPVALDRSKHPSAAHVGVHLGACGRTLARAIQLARRVASGPPSGVVRVCGMCFVCVCPRARHLNKGVLAWGSGLSAIAKRAVSPSSWRPLGRRSARPARNPWTPASSQGCARLAPQSHISVRHGLHDGLRAVRANGGHDLIEHGPPTRD